MYAKVARDSDAFNAGYVAGFAETQNRHISAEHRATMLRAMLDGLAAHDKSGAHPQHPAEIAYRRGRAEAYAYAGIIPAPPREGITLYAIVYRDTPADSFTFEYFKTEADAGQFTEWLAEPDQERGPLIIQDGSAVPGSPAEIHAAVLKLDAAELALTVYELPQMPDDKLATSRGRFYETLPELIAGNPTNRAALLAAYCYREMTSEEARRQTSQTPRAKAYRLFKHAQRLGHDLRPIVAQFPDLFAADLAEEPTR